MEQQFSPLSFSAGVGDGAPAPGSSITAGSAETVRAANKQSSQKRRAQKIHLHAERRPPRTPEHFRRNLEYTALIPGSINAPPCLLLLLPFLFFMLRRFCGDACSRFCLQAVFFFYYFWVLKCSGARS